MFYLLFWCCNTVNFWFCLVEICLLCMHLFQVATLMELECADFDLYGLLVLVGHMFFRCPCFQQFSQVLPLESTFFTSVSCVPTFATCFQIFVLIAIGVIWQLSSVVWICYVNQLLFTTGVLIALAYSVDGIIRIWFWYVWLDFFGTLIFTLSSLNNGDKFLQCQICFSDL